MKKRMMLAVATFAAGCATALVSPNAHAGVADGTLNNLHSLTGNDLLSEALDSTAASDSPSAVNHNANAHAEGRQNNSAG
ncbi:hypothetical protein ABZ721_10855 [Streptomyces sp. NPDC006733]|uniref:hypothetical protein n=1 Tax=Streptomyces sp. NPDC006733 TaxID=3155460 RepID=UPI003407E647